MFSAAMSKGQVSAEEVWKVWYVMLQVCRSDKGKSHVIRVPVQPTLKMFEAALRIPGVTPEIAWKVWSTMVQRGSATATTIRDTPVGR